MLKQNYDYIRIYFMKTLFKIENFILVASGEVDLWIGVRKYMQFDNSCDEPQPRKQ